MSFNRKIHIVHHTHWDREWYFSTCDSLVLADYVFKDIIDELEKNENLNFCFDGQISIIEDFLSMNPTYLKRFQNLVSHNQAYIGPWYTQTDTQLIDGISIVQNMYYGIYKSKELFDKYMQVGYLPDTFGFSNQLPMIYNQFDIQNGIIWRGADFEKQKIEPYFRWVADDHSEVTMAVLHHGYGMAKGMNESDAFIKKTLQPLIEEYKTLTTSHDILIPVGNDQTNIIPKLDKIVSKIDDDLFISDYEAFMKEVTPQIQTQYQGEFRDTAYTRIHKGCGGIRTDVKKSNYIAEQALISGLEPLNVLAKYSDRHISDGIIQEAWKLLFQGQAHDGIVGCVSDSVTEDILNRNKKSMELCLSSMNFIKKSMALSAHLKENEIMIYNLDIKPFRDYKEIIVVSHDEYIEIEGLLSQSILKTEKIEGYPQALVETPEGNHFEKEKDYYFHTLLIEVELPSFGYKTFKIKQSQQKQYPQKNVISNQYHKITVEDNKIKLYTQNQKIDNFIQIKDCGNAGDTYDFSPLKNDQEISLHIEEHHIDIKDNIETLILDCTTLLPYNLEEREQRKYTTKCPCTLEISLRNNSKNIYCSLNFDNKVLSHRLSVEISQNNEYDEVISATPLGAIARTIECKVDEDWRENNVEYPSSIETNSGFVAFKGDNAMTVYNKGLREYIASQKSISLTLFSSCGMLGKPNLLYRPGRASGDVTKKGHILIETPKAQLLYKETYEFMIAFEDNDIYTYYYQLKKYEMMDIYYQNQNINLFFERIDNKIQVIDNRKELPKEKSYFRLDGKYINFGVYNSYYDNDFKCRIMSFEDIKKAQLQCPYSFEISNLLEQGHNNQLVANRIYVIRSQNNENK